VIAAHRAGIQTVLLPKENKRDLDEIPDPIKEQLTVVLMSRAGKAIDEALIWD
jgi:ATP-dependent Lon protease